MSNYITEQVQDIFSEKQEWESFLLLCQNKNAIRDDWFRILKSKVNELALKSIPDDWGFSSWGTWDFQWFIKDFGNQSLSLWFREWYGSYSLTLWSSKNEFDNQKIYDLLQESKYSLIQSAFDRIDDVCGNDNEYHFIENGNFSFDDDSSSGNINIDKLAWYANYKTDDFAEQIIAMVNKFIRNSEITQMFREINESSKNADK